MVLISCWCVRVVVLPGYKAAELYAEVGIPVTVILDSAVGYVMEKVSERLCRAGGGQWQVGSGKGKGERRTRGRVWVKTGRGKRLCGKTLAGMGVRIRHARVHA